MLIIDPNDTSRPLWEHTEQGKEAAKFEKPYVFAEYPRMLYKAMLHPLSGGMEVSMARDILSPNGDRVVFSAEQFNNSCQLTVHDEAEYQKARARGWRESEKLALEYERGDEAQMAVSAAVRNWEDRNMSDGAKAEATAVESSLPGHVAEIPRRPVGRPPNKPRAEAAPAAE